jgi:hypothetical protein
MRECAFKSHVFTNINLNSSALLLLIMISMYTSTISCVVVFAHQLMREKLTFKGNDMKNKMQFSRVLPSFRAHLFSRINFNFKGFCIIMEVSVGQLIYIYEAFSPKEIKLKLKNCSRRGDEKTFNFVFMMNYWLYLLKMHSHYLWRLAN